MDVIIDVPDNEEKQSKPSVIPTVFGITIAIILVFIKMIGEKTHASAGGGMNRYLKYDIINI